MEINVFDFTKNNLGDYRALYFRLLNIIEEEEEKEETILTY